MPKTYCCKRCGYSTIQKNSIRQHYLRKKMCPASLEDVSIASMLGELDPDATASVPILLEPQNEACVQQGVSCPFCHAHCTSTGDLASHMNTCEPYKALGHSNVTNNVTNNNTTIINVIVNQNVLPFGQENLGHVSDDFIKQCILMLNLGFQDLISKIHFDPAVPENHNVKFKSNKQKLCMKYTQEGWVQSDQNTTINELIWKGQRIMSNLWLSKRLTDQDIAERNDAIMAWFQRTTPNVMNRCPDYYDLRSKLVSLMKTQAAKLLTTSQDEPVVAGGGA